MIGPGSPSLLSSAPPAITSGTCVRCTIPTATCSASARGSANDVDEPVLIGHHRAFPAVIDDHAPWHPAGVEDVLDPALGRIDDPDLARVIARRHVQIVPIVAQRHRKPAPASNPDHV